MSERLSFQPFDQHGALRIYYNGFLPHWRQIGCTYFVTFRLADSVPAGVVHQWRDERRRWLAAREILVDEADWSTKFRTLSQADQRSFERHFTTRLFVTLDEAHGACVLRQSSVAEIAFNATLHFHGQRVHCGDVVVMPNHVHALLTPMPGYELEHILHSIKSFSSNQINRKLGRTGTLWMEESHDHLVRDRDELQRIQGYIRRNPEKAGLPKGQYLLHQAEYQRSP